jgi:hypothetical protein
LERPFLLFGPYEYIQDYTIESYERSELVAFSGDAGKHRDPADKECPGRSFRIISRKADTKIVRCRTCGRMPADAWSWVQRFENRILRYFEKYPGTHAQRDVLNYVCLFGVGDGD